jgi:SAM-dependent methyltransferase
MVEAQAPDVLPAGLVRVRGGDATERAAVLDRFLVHAEVVAVVETGEQIELRLAEPVARSVLGIPDALVVEALPEPDGPPPTGLENDRPIRVLDDLWVRPPWVDPPADLPSGAIDLVVPRGGAFGSGEHESTQAALRLLHRLWPREPDGRGRRGLRVLDVGSGSGVLTAYVCVRGAEHVVACDIEGPATRATLELLRAPRPGLPVRGGVVLGGPEVFRRARERHGETRPGYDIVIANLAWHELERCIGTLLDLVCRGGLLITSGTRAHEESARDRAVGRVPDRADRVGATWFGAAWSFADTLQDV